MDDDSGADGLALQCWGFGSVVRIQRAYAAGMADRAELAERNREQEAIQRVSEERLRIARELHDVIGDSIALINVQAGVAAHYRQQPAAAKTGPRAHRRAEWGDAARDPRHVGLLRAEAAPDTRASAGRGRNPATRRRRPRIGAPVELVIEGDEPQIRRWWRSSAYRVVQESLTNVMKHGQDVTSVRVLLQYTGESWRSKWSTTAPP